MPVVKIELVRGKPLDYLKTFIDAVQRALVDTLGVPEEDKNIRLMEYDRELFTLNRPYEVLIEITMFSGRTKETKASLFKSMVDELKASLNVDPKTLFIIIYDQPKENWGMRGGVSAADIQFGFTIEK